jgi:hypothetical protein
MWPKVQVCRLRPKLQGENAASKVLPEDFVEGQLPQAAAANDTLRALVKAAKGQ